MPKRRMDQVGGRRVRRTVRDPSAISSRKVVKEYAGKKLSKQDRVNKLVTANIGRVIDRWNAIKDTVWLTSGTEQFPGTYSLDYSRPAASPSALPLYMFDLTGAYMNWSSLGPFTNACPMTRLTRASAAPEQYEYAPITHKRQNTAAGAPTENMYSWEMEDVNYVSDNICVGRKVLMEWCDIRMQLYGARKHPVKLTVQLIQFNDEQYVPRTFASTDNGSTFSVLEYDASTDWSTDIERWTRWQNFHDCMVDGIINNPISKRGLDSSCRGAYKVLYSKSFDFEPHNTFEGNACPHNVEFRLKYDMNKILTYENTGNPESRVARVDMDKSNYWENYDRSQLTSIINPKGRVYLRIYGETPLAAQDYPADTKTCDYAGSFDLLVRRKYTMPDVITP